MEVITQAKMKGFYSVKIFDKMANNGVMASSDLVERNVAWFTVM